MGLVTLVFGLALIILGAGFYVGTGAQSWTALIPAMAGVLLAICGGLSMGRAGLRMHAMHAAMTVALLTVLAGIGGLARGPGLSAAVEMIVMAVLALVLLVLGVWSFLAARREQTAES